MRNEMQTQEWKGYEHGWPSEIRKALKIKKYWNFRPVTLICRHGIWNSGPQVLVYHCSADWVIGTNTFGNF